MRSRRIKRTHMPRLEAHDAPKRACFDRCTQRSNFVDKMIDDVVRSTPSNAPMRSMT
jgi:hypothetical protein